MSPTNNTEFSSCSQKKGSVPCVRTLISNEMADLVELLEGDILRNIDLDTVQKERVKLIVDKLLLDICKANTFLCKNEMMDRLN